MSIAVLITESTMASITLSAAIPAERTFSKTRLGCPSNKMDTELGDIEFIGGNENGKREATMVS